MGAIWLREIGDEHGLAFWMPEETRDGSSFLG
jgi:hypothetical protein